MTKKQIFFDNDNKKDWQIPVFWGKMINNDPYKGKFCAFIFMCKSVIIGVDFGKILIAGKSRERC